MRGLYLKFPYIITIPLLWAGFVLAAFFRGTDSVSYAPALLCLGAFGGFLLWPGVKNGWRFPRTATVLLIALYGAYISLSVTWSSVPYTSLFFLFVFSALPFLFFSLILSPQPRDTARVYFFAMMAALAVLALWAVIQLLFLFGSSGPRIHHPLLSPNNLAVLMNMGLMPAVAFYMQARDRTRSVLLAGAAALFYIALLATQSRGGLSSAGISLIVLLPFVSRPFGMAVVAKGLALAAVIGGITFLFVAAMTHGGAEALLLTQGAWSGLADRMALWGTAWRMAWDHLWTGTGLATFYYHYTAYRLPVDRSDGYFAHMDPLQFWVEMGVAAPVLFYAVLTAILLRTVRALHKGKAGSPERAAVAGCFSGMLAAVLHTHIDFHLYLLVTLAPLAVLLAYWYTETEQIFGDARPLPFVGKTHHAVVCALVFALALSALWVARDGIGVRHLVKAEAAIVAGDTQAARAALDKAAFWMPGSSFHVPQYEARWTISMLHQERDSLGREDKQRLYERALDQSDRAIALNPAFAELHNDRAKLYFFAQDDILPDGYDKAVAEMEKALAMDPLLVDARMGLATLYLRQGERKKALGALEKGLAWPRPAGRRDIDFLVMVAQLRQSLGDQEGYNEMMNEVQARARFYGLVKMQKEAAPASSSE